MMQRKLKPMIALAIIGCCAWALLLSASRGPLFAMFLALFIAALPERSFKYRAVRRATICAITVGIVMFAFSFAPESTQERIVNFSTGNSTTTRLDLYRGAAHLASVNPQGIGWGQFGSTMQQPETYPHNVFLEVLVEAGWVPLFVLVVWIGFALKRARSDQLLLSCLLFMLLNALVSGDINGNRVLWSFVALAYLPTHGAIIRSSGKAAGLKKPAS